VTTATAPNGNSTANTYDAAGRLTARVTGTRASYGYSYNRAGTRLTEASTITGDPGNGTATFAYDPLGRLTSFTLPGIRTQGAAWDAVPNRTSQTIDGVPSAATFDPANRPTTAGYTADLDGRLTVRPGTNGSSLEWDSLGRLAAVRQAGSGTLVAGYAYDPLDRLVTVTRPGQPTVRFRYVGTSTATAQLVDDATGADIRKVTVGPEGTVLQDWTATTRRLYGTNAHHDTTWTADDTGAVTATLRSDPWGNVLRSSGSLPDWRFQGSWADSSTGLAWSVARWYDPVQGTFISEDVLLGDAMVPASRHLYAYAQGDPVGAWDPGGMAAHWVRYGRTLQTTFWSLTGGWRFHRALAAKTA
jgi:RHS repeat-associated protein